MWCTAGTILTTKSDMTSFTFYFFMAMNPSWPSAVEHDDVMKWKHFLRDWPFVRGIYRSPVTRSFDVSLICAWINGSVNNGEVGDLRRHRAYYDITVMWLDPQNYCQQNRVKFVTFSFTRFSWNNRPEGRVGRGPYYNFHRRMAAVIPRYKAAYPSVNKIANRYSKRRPLGLDILEGIHWQK